MTSHIRHKIVVQISTAKDNSKTFRTGYLFSFQLDGTIFKLTVFKNSKSIYPPLTLKQDIFFHIPIPTDNLPFIHKIIPSGNMSFFTVCHNFQVFKFNLCIIGSQTDKSFRPECRGGRTNFQIRMQIHIRPVLGKHFQYIIISTTVNRIIFQHQQMISSVSCMLNQRGIRHHSNLIRIPLNSCQIGSFSQR